MSQPQTITTDSGEELVVLSRRDYEALLARAGDEAAENVMAERIVAETAGETALPLEVWDAIEDGANAVRTIRKHRGLTQVELASDAGISQAYVAAIERGTKRGSVDALRAIAKALSVALDTIAE